MNEEIVGYRYQSGDLVCMDCTKAAALRSLRDTNPEATEEWVSVEDWHEELENISGEELAAEEITADEVRKAAAEGRFYSCEQCGERLPSE